MAYQQGIPVLVLREQGVIADGILEKGILPSYMPSFDTRSSVKSYLVGREWQQIFHQWFTDVQRSFHDQSSPFLLEPSPEPFFRPQASTRPETPLEQATATLQRVTVSPDTEDACTGQIFAIGHTSASGYAGTSGRKVASIASVQHPAEPLPAIHFIGMQTSDAWRTPEEVVSAILRASREEGDYTEVAKSALLAALTNEVFSAIVRASGDV